MLGSTQWRRLLVDYDIHKRRNGRIMNYEVEQKHRLNDVEALVAQLRDRGVTLQLEVAQSDRYFRHPVRDFAKTDEALRIRAAAGRSFVTYKGPKLDTTTKTRRELELPLHVDDSDGSQFAELLSALGFSPVATVRKQRRIFHIAHSGREVEGALDEVDGVGAFVELELSADDATLDDAKRAIRELAADLGLGATERRSYLELLLEQRSKPAAN
jgi:adenylate cyclase class 2